MKVRSPFLAAVMALAAALTCPAKPLRIGYLYGQKEYDGEGSCRWLAKRMETVHGAKTFFFAGADIETDTSEATAWVLANIHELDSLDVLVIFVRRLWLNQAQLARMKAFLNSGRGLVGIRAAQYAFQSWDKGFGIDSVVLGGAYNMHGPKTGYDLELAPRAASHPILAGVKPWRAGNSLYNQDYLGKRLAPDSEPLLYGIQGSVRMPVAWTRLRMGSRIFVTTTGVQEDFQQADFQAMITAAVLWAGKVEPTGSSPASRSPRAAPTRAGVTGMFRWDGRLIGRPHGPGLLLR